MLWQRHAECPVDECGIQYFPVPAVGGIRPVVLWMVRNKTARSLGKCRRHKGFEYEWPAEHLPHGIHTGTGQLLLHGSYHWTAARGDDDQWQLGGTCIGNVWLCPGSRSAIHALRHVPFMAEAGTEVGFVDDHY